MLNKISYLCKVNERTPIKTFVTPPYRKSLSDKVGRQMYEKCLNIQNERTNNLMKLSKKFLKNLPVGTDRWFEDIDDSNLRSIHTMCAEIHRWGHPYKITKEIDAKGHRVRIKVDHYDDGQGFKDSPSHVEGNQDGTIGT